MQRLKLLDFHFVSRFRSWLWLWSCSACSQARVRAGVAAHGEDRYSGPNSWSTASLLGKWLHSQSIPLSPLSSTTPLREFIACAEVEGVCSKIPALGTQIGGKQACIRLARTRELLDTHPASSCATTSSHPQSITCAGVSIEDLSRAYTLFHSFTLHPVDPFANHPSCPASASSTSSSPLRL